jgi:hypothetical protein
MLANDEYQELAKKYNAEKNEAILKQIWEDGRGC